MFDMFIYNDKIKKWLIKVIDNREEWIVYEKTQESFKIK